MRSTFDPAGGPHIQVKIGSNRNFGLIFAALFAFISLWPVVRGERIVLWALVLAAGFFAVALAMPRLLGPLNRFWFRLGILLGSVMTPVVMGVLFFIAVTPIAFVMRLFGNDPLRLKRKYVKRSYFVQRSPPGPLVGSLKDQF